MAFFEQNHGLIALEKCDFWNFEIFNFLWQRKVYFLSITLLNPLLSLMLTENKYIKK